MATKQLKYAHWDYVCYRAKTDKNVILQDKIDKIKSHPNADKFSIGATYYDMLMIATAMWPKASKPKLQRIALESVLVKLNYPIILDN